MTTLTTLDAEYADLLRVRVSSISAADVPTLTSLAQSVDAKATTLAAATDAVIRLASSTTDVAVLSYNFFTGTTPYASGLDYLVSPASSNTNNLNSAYYQSFNTENRFINFAVNLGKLGEGAQRFSAAYGALSLSDTLVQAYTTIFGAAPGAAQVSSLLNDAVPNGLGGTETRAQYFAYYGGDGPSGMGAKAALVGWLLAQAVKEDVGAYAKANDAFLADLAPDGLASFHVDLVQTYGPPAAFAQGATITFSSGQSVSTTSGDAALRSTNNADTITTTGDVDSGATVSTGGGNDTLTIPGVVNGTVTLGDGNDTVSLGGVDQGTTPGRYGSVTLGSGNNTVYLNGGMEAGTSLSASGDNNVLHLNASLGTTFAASNTGVQTIFGFQTVYVDSAGGAAGVPASAQVIYDRVPTTSGYNGFVNLTERLGQTVVAQNTSVGLYVSSLDTSGAVLFLDHFLGGPATKTFSFGGPSYTGGAIVFQTPSSPDDSAEKSSVITLHVSTSSTVGLIDAYAPTFIPGPLNYPSYVPIPNLIITGAGSLSAQILSTFTSVDASGGGDLTVSYSGPVSGAIFRFSNGTDTLSAGLAASSATTVASTPNRFIFGLGVDTLTVTGSSLSNLFLAPGQTVAAPSQIEGFKKGVDHLVLDAVTTTLTPGVQAYDGAATTLTQVLINVSSHVAAGTAAAFEFGGDTYVYQQDSTLGVNTGDGLIRLVGVTGLTTASGSGVGDIHVHG